MKKCTECGRRMRELTAKTPEGIGYRYFKCTGCGDEIVGMGQLHEVAQKYRMMKSFDVKLSKWGMSLGVRIPKQLVKKYRFRKDSKVTIIPKKDGIKIIPS